MKLSKDLLETWQGMIDYGTGGFDIFKIIEDAAKEAEQLESRISALEFDTKPLTREELETVLKDAGWIKSKYISLYSHEKHTGEIKISDAILWFGQYCIPLSAVTRRLLRDCGVIE